MDPVIKKDPSRVDVFSIGTSPNKKRKINDDDPNGNSFYYHSLDPAETSRKGRWSSEEKDLFLRVLEKYNSNPIDWGLLSRDIPGRTGLQCFNFYKSLLKKSTLEYEGKVKHLPTERTFIKNIEKVPTNQFSFKDGLKSWIATYSVSPIDKENKINQSTYSLKKNINKAIKEKLHPKLTTVRYNYYVILDSTPKNGKLLLSGKSFSSNLEGLKDHNIQLILNCTKEVPNYFTAHTFDYIKLGLIDSEHQTIYNYFDTCADKIHKYLLTGQSVLVHCQQGKSRSVSFIVAYLLKYAKMNLSVILAYLSSKEVVMKINDGFMQALANYEVDILRSSSFAVKKTSRRGKLVDKARKTETTQKSLFHYFQPIIQDTHDTLSCFKMNDTDDKHMESEFFNLDALSKI